MRANHITPRVLQKWISRYIDRPENGLVLYGNGVNSYNAAIDTIKVDRTHQDNTIELNIEYETDRFLFFVEGDSDNHLAGFTFMGSNHSVLEVRDDIEKVSYLRTSAYPITCAEFLNQLQNLPQDLPILYNPDVPGNVYLELTAISDVGFTDSNFFANSLLLMADDFKQQLENFKFILYFYIRPLPFYFSEITLFKSHISESTEYFGHENYIDYLEALVNLNTDNIYFNKNRKCRNCHYYIRPERRLAENNLTCSLANHNAIDDETTDPGTCDDFRIAGGTKTCQTCLFKDPETGNCTHCGNSKLEITGLGEIKLEQKIQPPMYGSCEYWKLAYHL